ncbi:MAG: TonB-dependent siderophore receptor [Proteobacteria bacterium]|nr:MAG: TonB-dependent siderophore receptor [Pseudomonadota bacterium]
MNTYSLRTALCLTAASTIALAIPAHAQDEAPSPEEILVTAQKQNQSEVSREGNIGAFGPKAAEDVPFSVKSYNAALILNQQPQTLGQVLENDPSVRTTYGYGNAAEQFVIRGFPLFGDDIGFDGLYGLVPRQLVAPELYESVQVLNGASAFINGAAPGGSGLGGSVNLVPKRAEGKLQRATVGFTSDGQIGTSGDMARRFGDVGLRFNRAYRFGDVSIDDEYRRTLVLGGAFDYDGGPLRLSLDLAYQLSRVEGLRHKVKISGAIPEVPEADHNFAQAWTYTEMRDIFGIAKLEYDISENAMFYASFGARDGREEGTYGGITVNNALTGAATYDSAYIPRTDNNEAATAGIRAKVDIGGVSNEINLGGSLTWQVNRNAYDFYASSLTPDTNLYEDVVLAAPTTSAFAGGDLDNPFPLSRTRLSSAFLSDTVGFAEDRVLVTAGVRVQAIKVTGYSYADGSQQSEYDETAFTPVFGVVVKPVDGLSLFANRIEGLAQGGSSPVDDDYVNPGEIFAPFKSTQYEAGVKLGSDRFNASLALYQTDKPSLMTIDDPDGSGLALYGYFGKQRNRGIELSVDGEPVDGLRIIAGASINDAKFLETDSGANEGNKVPGMPDYTVNANVEWDLPFWTALTLTGRVIHTGPQQVDAANTLELDDWTRFDVGMRYVALAGDMPITLRFNIDNVANSRYWASAFDAFLPQLLQGAPRTFKASASIDF